MISPSPAPPEIATYSYSQRATRYARRVTAGKIPACKWIKLACQRFLDDLSNLDSRWRYDETKAHRVCAYAERQRHEKGELQGQRFLLQDWQIWLLCNIFGLVDNKGIRKYREAFILVPRGQGKSPLAAIIALWMAFFDGEKGAEVYTAATTEKQAFEVFRPAKAFVEQDPGYGKLGIVAAAKTIHRHKSRSRFAPVIGRSRYGGSIYCGILDEAHQLPDSQLYDTFKTGCNKRKNSLLLTISTAGVSAFSNPCYSLQIEVQKVLEGSIDNERLFGAIYTIDASVEWHTREALVMSNPNLGISNDEEALLLDQAEAKRNPARQNAFRCMHLNEWVSAASAWMNMSKWNACFDASLTPDKVKDLPCWLSSDLASKLDLAAIVALFRKDIDGKPHYYCFVRCYLPEERVNAPENSHYQKWAKQGYLTATDGSSLDYSKVEEDTLLDIASYKVEELTYDPRYADQYSQRVAEQAGITRVEVPPSPAVLSPAMKELESAIYDGRFHHDGHPILTWAMSNVLTRETSAGNYTMPDKSKPESKIDPAIALFLGMTRAMLSTAKPKKAAFKAFRI